MPENGEKKIWFPQTMHVTPDESKVAVLFQATEHENTASDIYHQRKLFIYDLSAGLTAENSWKPAKEIDVSTLPSATFLSNRLVRISPDGLSVIVGLTDGSVVRFDSGTGELVSQWQFDFRYEVSADGKYVAGCLAGSHDLKIFRISDGQEKPRSAMSLQFRVDVLAMMTRLFWFLDSVENSKRMEWKMDN